MYRTAALHFDGDVDARPELQRHDASARPDVAQRAISAAQVEAALHRGSILRLRFPAEIERRYETDTRAARVWNICLTVPLGLIAYNAFCFVDATLLPDLGWIPLLLRLCVITPVGLLAMWIASRLSASVREPFISYAITGALMILLGLIATSRAPLAPYVMFAVLLASMFGTITMRLRFHWACLFTGMTMTGVGLMLCARHDLPGGLAANIMIATTTCCGFGIVANNQLERAERRSYLLGLREMLRSEKLHADTAIYSALSRTDSLTGLANRRAFDARLGEHWDARAADGGRMSLLMIDVDHFKRFNDRYGHPGGDACLSRVARALETVVVRQADMVARYGGEEFTVLLTDCGLAEAVRIGERLCSAVANAAIPHDDRDDGLSIVTISVGAACNGTGQTPEELFALADRDLYAAKRGGRNRVGAAALTSEPV